MQKIFYSTDTGFYTGSTIDISSSRSEHSAFMLKSLLKSAGWIVKGSSDGYTIFSFATGSGVSSSDVITNYNVNSNIPFVGILPFTGSMANHGAWFVLQNGTSASFSFQIDKSVSNLYYGGQNPTSWRIKYSIKGFNMSTSDYLKTPSPIYTGDELILVGGGTDATPTYASYFTYSGLTKFNAGAISGSNWSFYCAPFHSTSLFFTDSFLYEGLQNPVPGDVNPYAITCRTADTNNVQDGWRRMLDDHGNTSGNRTLIALTDFSYNSGTVIGANITPLRLTTPETNDNPTVIPSGLGTNVFTGRDDEFPIVWASSATFNAAYGPGLGGYRGIGTLGKWLGAQRTARDLLFSTGSNGSVETRLVITTNDSSTYHLYLTVPWSGSTSIT